jgi:uncharacterized protein
MEKEELLNKIKSEIQLLEPEADIILYGSRARGDFRKDSDWDILILVDGTINQFRKNKIKDSIYEIEWDTGEVLVSIIRSREQWNSPLQKITPFYKNIVQEGIFI